MEHTLLAPDASDVAIEQLCAEAVMHGLRAVCVNPVHIVRAVRSLQGAAPYVVSVIGFPTGATFTQAKVCEAVCAVEAGASELDMVMRTGALKEGKTAEVEADIDAVVRAAGACPVKVIIESGLLSYEEIRLACRILENAGAVFGKTSTGFFGVGATVEVVATMRQALSSSIGIKASGGIKTRMQAEKLVAAGAERIGCSASLDILGEKT
jgi:deoxyribose-phosphate aldolase